MMCEMEALKWTWEELTLSAYIVYPKISNTSPASYQAIMNKSAKDNKHN